MDRNEQKERDKLFRQSLGKFFIDLSKLVFAGVVVGGVVQLTQSRDYALMAVMVVLGILVSCIFAFVGFKILRWYDRIDYDIWYMWGDRYRHIDLVILQAGQEVAGKFLNWHGSNGYILRRMGCGCCLICAMAEIKEGQGLAGEPVKDLHKPSIMAGRFL